VGATRFLVWRGSDDWRAEGTHVEFDDGGLRATGTQIGGDPLPYRVDYALDATDGFRTRRFEVTAAADDGTRRLVLERSTDDEWRIDGETATALAGAQDCDLGLSPLTNFMPLRRHRLHERDGGADFLMAWVEVPNLVVHASAQRYEHVAPGVVRFIDRGLFDGFTADLELDADGLVLRYPDLAERV
jgi:hypothetical protein